MPQIAPPYGNCSADVITWNTDQTYLDNQLPLKGTRGKTHINM